MGDASAQPRVLIVHPPVSVARDYIDYPYLADLGAVQLASVLRARGDEVCLVDAYALASSSLEWRPDSRAHLGASVGDVLAQCRLALPGIDAVIVDCTPYH